jgi:hypothetical protein
MGMSEFYGGGEKSESIGRADEATSSQLGSIGQGPSSAACIITTSYLISDRDRNDWPITSFVFEQPRSELRPSKTRGKQWACHAHQEIFGSTQRPSAR